MSRLFRFLPTFGLLFGATVWGVIWYPYRLLQEAGISGVASSLLTYAFALAIGWFFFKRPRPVFSRALLSLALAAGWTNLSYVLAVIDGEVMRIMLLFYLSPLWTLLFAYGLLDERSGWSGAGVVALSLAGAGVMLWQPGAGLPMPRNQAEWLGLSSGITFALTNVLTRRVAHLSMASKCLSVWLGVVAVALGFLPFESQPWGTASALGLQSVLLMLGIGMALMLATWLVQYGITHTPVTRASVIFLFELVVAAVTSYWLAREGLSLREWLGGAMIVTAALCAMRLQPAPPVSQASTAP